MALLQLQSTNPQFSYVIKKNPQSGMMIRTIRKGMAYGWYSDDETYQVYFKDADNDVSYKQHEQEQFEYLNVSRYNTPLFPLHAIGTFFSSAYKAQDERDVAGYTHTCTIQLIHIALPRYVTQFEQHLKDVSFGMTHQVHKSYTLTISTETSLYHLLHVVRVLCLFLAMFGEEYVDTSDDVLDKTIHSIHVIDAPFYIRHLFARNFLHTREQFRKYRAALEQTDRYTIQFAYGNTAFQRRSFLYESLAFDKPILDIGCGEGYYAIPFAAKTEGSYYAVDIDEERLAQVRRKATAHQLDTILTYGSLEQFLAQYNGERVDVIVSEVIEHMPLEDAAALLRSICRHVAFDRCIITTPNADFNPYYELTGFRHDDHRWELGQDAFQQWVGTVFAEEQLTYTFVGIGDQVDGISTTQGVIVCRTEEAAISKEALNRKEGA